MRAHLPRAAAMVTAFLLAGNVLLAGSLLLAPSASAQPSRDRYALGDSVMLGAKSSLKGRGFAVVDATESRQAYSGAALLRKRGAALPSNVVVHLGTNGTFRLSDCKAMVRAAGPDRRVFFVTIHVPRSWAKGNNEVIRECDAAYADDRVHVIDWDWAASQHPAWLYDDRTHLRPNGARAFARIVDSAVDTAEADARQAVESASGTVDASATG